MTSCRGADEVKNMVTMEKVKAEKKKLAEIETKLMHLQKINEIDAILSGKDFIVSVAAVDGCFANTPIQISFALNDGEQSVMAKGIQVVLEYARQRIENELEGYE